MGLDIQKRAKATQKVHTGLKVTSSTLDATTTTETLILHTIAEKISWQSDGTLAGNIEFSINGVDFFSSTAFTATTPGSFNTHNVVAIKITRTGGTGKLHIAAK